MLVMDDDAQKWLLKLHEELAWLCENHPDKVALIGLAKSHLQTVEMAGSIRSSTFAMRTSILESIDKGRGITPGGHS